MTSSSQPKLVSRWRRAGQQPRSRTTQDALLAAAEELFGRRGVDSTAVTAVARHAGRSIGSLYHHFESKETLVVAVVDRILGDLEAGISSSHDPTRWEGLTIEDIVRRFVGTALELEGARPGYKRVLIEVSLTDHETRERYKQLRRRLSEGLTQRLLDRRHEIGHPDPETAARFAVDQLSAMLAARLDREATPTELESRSDEDFTAEAVASVSAYLRTNDS